MTQESHCYSINLSTANGVLEYKKIISAMNIENPYYSYEIMNDSANLGKLKCFVLSHMNQPVIAMPFHLIPITINNELTPYFDVSSPYGFSGPLYAPDTPDALITTFWEELNKWYVEKNVVSEFIRFGLNYNYRCYNGELVPSLLNVKGKLIGMDRIWENFKPKVRNNVRKAQKENLECIIYHNNISPKVIAIFHEIYINTMIRNKAEKRYFFDLSYFQLLVQENVGSCAIGIVYLGEIPISVEFILISSNTIYSHLGGTVAAYFNYRPNDFLKLKIMSWAIEIQKKFYVLGGGRENGDPLYEYKKSYFPKDVDVIYYTGRKIVQPKIYTQLIAMQRDHFEDDLPKNNYFPKYRYKK